MYLRAIRIGNDSRSIRGVFKLIGRRATPTEPAHLNRAAQVQTNCSLAPGGPSGDTSNTYLANAGEAPARRGIGSDQETSPHLCLASPFGVRQRSAWARKTRSFRRATATHIRRPPAATSASPVT